MFRPWLSWSFSRNFERRKFHLFILTLRFLFVFSKFLEKDQGNPGRNVGAKNSSAGAAGEIRIRIEECLYQIEAKSYRFWKFIGTEANLLQLSVVKLTVLTHWWPSQPCRNQTCLFWSFFIDYSPGGGDFLSQHRRSLFDGCLVIFIPLLPVQSRSSGSVVYGYALDCPSLTAHLKNRACSPIQPPSRRWASQSKHFQFL